MSDKEFDKIFSERLREERNFSYQDNDWEQLSNRLDAAGQMLERDKKRRGLAWLWLLMIPIVAILLWELDDIKNQNKQLSTQLALVQSQLTTHVQTGEVRVQNVQKADTVFIYQNAPKVQSTKRTNVPPASFSKKSPKTQRIDDPSVSNTLDAFSTKKTLDGTPILSGVLEQPIAKQDTLAPKQPNEEKKIAELNEKLALLDKQIADLKQVLSDTKANTLLLNDCGTKQDLLKKQLLEATVLVDSLKKQSLTSEPKKTDNFLKNNRLFVGFQGGRINYRATWVNTLGIDLFKDIKSYQAGMKLEYALTDRWRLTADGNFCPFSFTNYWQNSRYNLPTMQFDATKEKFFKSETSQSLLQGNIGVKYFFTEGVSKWRPYVSLGYTMMYIKPFETKYTYQSLWSPTTNRDEMVQSAGVKIPNLVMFNGGLEYRFSRYVVAQAEAFYYKDVNSNHKTFDLFGLRAAVLLNLK